MSRAGKYRVCLAWVFLAVLAVPASASAAEASYDSGSTTIAAKRLTRAQRAIYHGHFSEAFGIMDTLLADAPNDGGAYLARARMYMETGQYREAQADLDRVLTMHPDAVGLAMVQVNILLRQSRGDAALGALTVAAKMPMQSYWHDPYEAGAGETANGFQRYATQHMRSRMFEYSSIAQLLLDRDDAALRDMTEMMKQETVEPWHILADYCYTAALAGRVDMAEVTCQEAIDQHPTPAGQYDSMGFTHLRMRAWDKAIADYNTELESRPDLTLSLYGRGLARRAKGDVAGGNADIAAAKAGEPDIANIMKRLGAPEV